MTSGLALVLIYVLIAIIGSISAFCFIIALENN
jgi:hypothetical protein